MDGTNESNLREWYFRVGWLPHLRSRTAVTCVTDYLTPSSSRSNIPSTQVGAVSLARIRLGVWP
jgi:hypothetical protein